MSCLYPKLSVSLYVLSYHSSNPYLITMFMNYSSQVLVVATINNTWYESKSSLDTFSSSSIIFVFLFQPNTHMHNVYTCHSWNIESFSCHNPYYPYFLDEPSPSSWKFEFDISYCSFFINYSTSFLSFLKKIIGLSQQSLFNILFIFSIIQSKLLSLNCFIVVSYSNCSKNLSP